MDQVRCMASAQQNFAQSKAVHTQTSPESLEEQYDFSPVLGGPIFQLFRRSHLAGNALELLHRRLLVITLVAWLPLMLLAIFNSSVGSVVGLSFFRDIQVHVRFLVGLPVLIAAELIVHSRIRPVVRRFVERRIVLAQDLPRFHRAIESALRLRNSIPLEIRLLLLVYPLGIWTWQTRVPIEGATWYAMPGGPWNLTPAGFWYVLVSIPLLRFILLRWYLRLFIWFHFLWQVSRINLNLIPTPPRSRCWSFLSGQECLCLRSYSFCAGCYACGRRC